jgi:hypothetical protein
VRTFRGTSPRKEGRGRRITETPYHRILTTHSQHVQRDMQMRKGRSREEHRIDPHHVISDQEDVEEDKTESGTASHHQNKQVCCLLLGVLDTINVTNHQRLNPFSISCSIIVSRPPTVGRSEPEIVQRARAALDTQANGIDLISRKYLEQLVDIDSYK